MLFAMPLALINPALMVLGIIPVCVWFAYFFARFAAATSAIVLEDVGVDKALSRSSALTRGLKWHVLRTYLIMFALYMVLGVGLMMVIALTQSVVITTVSQTLLVIVGYPIVGLTEMLLYYDLRIRKEGFDIEVMAGALDAQPQQAASS